MHENDLTCFNKIKGWAVWKGKDSVETEFYIHCVIKKEGKTKNVVVYLPVGERGDVGEYLKNEAYIHCGFDSYMPGVIINNQQYIETIELIVKNGICGKYVIKEYTKKDA